MGVVSFLKLLLGLASKMAEYANNQQLLEAGASQAILKGLREANDAISRANTARANYDSLPIDSDPQNRRRPK